MVGASNKSTAAVKRPTRLGGAAMNIAKASPENPTSAAKPSHSPATATNPEPDSQSKILESIANAAKRSAPLRIPEPNVRLARTSHAPFPTRRPNAGRSNTSLPSLGTTWLPSTTSTSSQQEALRLLDQAMREYSRKAWASAEASAWDSLRHTAEGIDIADRNASKGQNRGASSATTDLRMAREAIRESRDFAGKYGDLDAAAVERIVLSHNTAALKNQSMRNVPATDAVDRYLDEARMRLSRLASFRPEAAQALDLIAAIYLGRGDDTLLPSQTSLCLRRAALQGQPGNSSLASRLGMHLAAVGLDNEAKWALEHSQSIAPSAEAQETLDLVTQRAGQRAEAIRVAARMRSRLPSGYDPNVGDHPTVLQLSPREFASASRSVMGPKQGNQNTAAPVSYRPQKVAEPANAAPTPNVQRGFQLPGSATQAANVQQAASLPILAPHQPVVQQAISQPGLSAPSVNAPARYVPGTTGFDDLLGTPASFAAKPPKSKVKQLMNSINPWK